MIAPTPLFVRPRQYRLNRIDIQCREQRKRVGGLPHYEPESNKFVFKNLLKSNLVGTLTIRMALIVRLDMLTRFYGRCHDKFSICLCPPSPTGSFHRLFAVLEKPEKQHFSLDSASFRYSLYSMFTGSPSSSHNFKPKSGVLARSEVGEYVAPYSFGAAE